MTRRDRGAAPDERGFTLVELLFALLILAIVMVALAPAFYGMMKSSSASRQRSVADGLAVTAAEQIRSYPYWEVGYSIDVNNVNHTPSYCTGTSPVTVSSSPMDALANQTVAASGTTYQIQSCVYWQQASDGSGAAYKESVVNVMWGPSKQYSYTLSSALYPGAEGSYQPGGMQNFPPGQNDNSTGLGPVPAPVANSAAPLTGSSTAIQVDWKPVTYPATVEYYIEWWSPPGSGLGSCSSGPQSVIKVPVGNGSSDGSGGIDGNVTGLSPGTSYCFDVMAVSGTSWSPASNVVGAATNSTTSTTCQITGIAVSPNGASGSAVINSAGAPVGWTALNVSVSQSNCSNLSVEYGVNASNGHPSAPLTLVSLSGSTGTLTGSAAQGSWSATAYGFVVYNNGTATSAQANVTPCQEKGNSGHC